MERALIRRNILPLAEEILEDTPITVITGARQVGKSTLMRQLVAGRNHRYVNLDNTAEQESAKNDPDGFVRQFPGGMLAIDEVQRVPSLLTALKSAVDDDRQPGRFIITGSADLLSLRGGQESLAGRAQTVPLEPLSRGEIEGRVEDFPSFMWRLAPTGQLPAPPELSRRDYLSLCVTSAFPGIYNLTLRQQYRWLGNFVERILSKDAGDITGINHPDRLELLLQVLAAENSSETVAATMSRNIDIPERSIPTYIQALRQVFLVKQLPGWSSNTTKKAISRKKTTLVDVGLAAFLSGADVDGLERAISSTTTGGLVEGFVVGELSRQLSWSKIDAKLYHFRDSQKNEVDIVLENRKREIVGLEVKAATSIGKSDFKGLEFLRDAVGDRFVSGAVLYTGTNALPFGDRLWALPISTIWSI